MSAPAFTPPGRQRERTPSTRAHRGAADAACVGELTHRPHPLSFWLGSNAKRPGAVRTCGRWCVREGILSVSLAASEKHWVQDVKHPAPKDEDPPHRKTRPQHTTAATPETADNTTNQEGAWVGCGTPDATRTPPLPPSREFDWAGGRAHTPSRATPAVGYRAGGSTQLLLRAPCGYGCSGGGRRAAQAAGAPRTRAAQRLLCAARRSTHVWLRGVRLAQEP